VRRLATAAAIGLVLVACATTDEAAPVGPVHQYRVLLLPVEGAREALREPLGEESIAVALTPAELDATLRDGLLEAGIFSDTVPLATPESGSDGILSAAVEEARRREADLLLRVYVKSTRIRDLGTNGNAVWSTLAWLAVPTPLWLIDDHSYGTEFAVLAELLSPDDVDRPLASFVATSGDQTLDLWDRGVSPFVIVVPPALLNGSDEKVSRELTRRATGQLMGSLVEALRTGRISSRFDLEFETGPGSVRVVATSRRVLRSLDIRAHGERVAFWAETDIRPRSGDGSDLLHYEFEAALPGPKRRPLAIRVIAEDEIGGREVRTVVLEEES
jgi:hypothetical protein